MPSSSSIESSSKRKVAVVTGAGSGVGRAIARRFAEEGYDVALLARSREALDGVSEEVESHGVRALKLPTDVADYEQVEAAAAAVEESLGPIDVWVNDAMTTVFAFFEDIEPAEFKRATEVTYLGSVWGTKAALKRMRERDSGVIVFVGSAMAYRSIPLQSPYCGAKHAMKGFFESLLTELIHQGSKVRVTMVQLPGLNTPQFDHCRSKMPKKPQPVPPIYQPEVAADAVYFAATHPRREVYVGVSSVYTIWGNKVAPWLMDRYLAKTAVSSQQTQEPLGEDVREGNLFQASGRDSGAHGDFDDQAHSRSLQLELTKRRGLVFGLLPLVVAGVVGARRSRDEPQEGLISVIEKAKRLAEEAIASSGDRLEIRSRL